MRLAKDDRKKWNGGKWITPERRLALYIRDSFTCTCCGRDLKNTGPSETALDHLTPRSHGGGNESSNLVTICRSCNSSRGDKVWTEYYPGGAQERVLYLTIQPVNLALAKALIAGTAGHESEAAR